jgi:hypothetical protein
MNKMTNMAGLAVSYLALVRAEALPPERADALEEADRPGGRVDPDPGVQRADPDRRGQHGPGRPCALEAARKLGLESVPCVRLSHMSKAQKKAFILADNRLSLNAGWNEDLLSLELKELAGLDKDFDIGITGFSVAEIDGLLDGMAVEEPGNPKDDRLPELAEVAVTRPGDLWILGPHRLLCGSALSGEDCSRLMAGAKAQFVITDPPYNVPIAGHVGGGQDPAPGVRDGLGRDDARASSPSSSRMPSGISPPTASMARSTWCSWTGATWARSGTPAPGSIPSSRT